MAKVSISIVKGKGSVNHNNREFVTDNVDRDRIKDNIIYKCESLEDAYRYCFEQAITEYNAKQKRADRRIDGVRGYIEKIRTSKNGEKLFYENLIQVGNMYDYAHYYEKCVVDMDGVDSQGGTIVCDIAEDLDFDRKEILNQCEYAEEI